MPHKDPELRRKYHRNYLQKWIADNPEKWKGYQRRSDRKRWKDRTAMRVKQLSEVRYRRHHRNKVAVLDKYGSKCAFCGDDRYEVLCVDHVMNDGAAHRRSKEYKRLNVGGMWGFLVKTPFRPDLYQILCHNCNQAKARYQVMPGAESYRPLAWWRQASELKMKKRLHGTSI